MANKFSQARKQKSKTLAYIWKIYMGHIQIVEVLSFIGSGNLEMQNRHRIINSTEGTLAKKVQLQKLYRLGL